MRGADYIRLLSRIDEAYAVARLVVDRIRARRALPTKAEIRAEARAARERVTRG